MIGLVFVTLFLIGTFYEGLMTSGMTSDATDAAIQADIIAAGYGA